MGLYCPLDPVQAGKFSVEIRQDLFDHHRRNEDGEPLIGEAFYVTVSNTRGRRWASDKVFTTRVEVAEEGGYYLYGYDEAKRRAGELFAHVITLLHVGRKLLPEEWSEIEPVYGSEEYISSGEELRRVWEERQAG